MVCDFVKGRGAHYRGPPKGDTGPSAAAVCVLQSALCGQQQNPEEREGVSAAARPQTMGRKGTYWDSGA